MEQYQTLQLVGEGSFGKVYKGRRLKCGQIVALKFIPKAGRNEADLFALRREIDILRGMRHENIVQMFDFVETDEYFCVVTEFAQARAAASAAMLVKVTTAQPLLTRTTPSAPASPPQGQLFEILQDDRALPESAVQPIAVQLVRALHYLHSQRVIHRDMKPQNVLIGANSRVMLCDFGFARAMSQQTTVVASIKGTPLYMAPELVQERPYDHTADLWALGVILYELYTGKPPFYTNNIYALVSMIVTADVSWPPTISADFRSFLGGLLQKDARQRLGWPQLLHHPFLEGAAPVPPALVPDHAVRLRARFPDAFLSVLPVASRAQGAHDGAARQEQQRWIEQQREQTQETQPQEHPPEALSTRRSPGETEELSSSERGRGSHGVVEDGTEEPAAAALAQQANAEQRSVVAQIVPTRDARAQPLAGGRASRPQAEQREDTGPADQEAVRCGASPQPEVGVPIHAVMGCVHSADGVAVEVSAADGLTACTPAHDGTAAREEPLPLSPAALSAAVAARREARTPRKSPLELRLLRQERRRRASPHAQLPATEDGTCREGGTGAAEGCTQVEAVIREAEMVSHEIAPVEFAAGTPEEAAGCRAFAAGMPVMGMDASPSQPQYHVMLPSARLGFERIRSPLAPLPQMASPPHALDRTPESTPNGATQRRLEQLFQPSDPAVDGVLRPGAEGDPTWLREGEASGRAPEAVLVGISEVQAWGTPRLRAVLAPCATAAEMSVADKSSRFDGADSTHTGAGDRARALRRLDKDAGTNPIVPVAMRTLSSPASASGLSGNGPSLHAGSETTPGSPPPTDGFPSEKVAPDTGVPAIKGGSEGGAAAARAPGKAWGEAEADIGASRCDISSSVARLSISPTVSHASDLSSVSGEARDALSGSHAARWAQAGADSWAETQMDIETEAQANLQDAADVSAQGAMASSNPGAGRVKAEVGILLSSLVAGTALAHIGDSMRMLADLLATSCATNGAATSLGVTRLELVDPSLHSAAEVAAFPEASQSLHEYAAALLLPHSRAAAAWVDTDAPAPLGGLRVLRACCEASPTLAAALAADVRLVDAIWAHVPLSCPSDSAENTPASQSLHLSALHLLCSLLAHDSMFLGASDQPAGVSAGSAAGGTVARLDAALTDSLPRTRMRQLLRPLGSFAGGKLEDSVALHSSATNRPTGAGSFSLCGPKIYARIAEASAVCIALALQHEPRGIAADRFHSAALDQAGGPSTRGALGMLISEGGPSIVKLTVRWLHLLTTDTPVENDSSPRAAASWAIEDDPGTGQPPIADGFAVLLHRLLSRLPPGHPCCAPTGHSSFWHMLAAALPSTALSARGLQAIVSALHGGLSHQAPRSASLLLEGSLLRALLATLEPAALRSLSRVPPARGGGRGSVGKLLGASCRALYVPFAAGGEADPDALVRLQQRLYAEGLVGVLRDAMPEAEPAHREVRLPRSRVRSARDLPPCKNPAPSTPVVRGVPCSSNGCALNSGMAHPRARIALHARAARLCAAQARSSAAGCPAGPRCPLDT